ncbi:hypothetical protein H7I42_03955, partial [Mycolicibacterium vanbaalenii PYR-1]|nr:hypothetical protein [Mycolicibacterium vanbaalenii PYR-1]
MARRLSKTVDASDGNILRCAGAGPRYWIAAGTGGAAVMGVGLLAGLCSETPATVERPVRLASFDSLIVANSPVPEDIWLFGAAGSPKRDRSGPATAAAPGVAAVRPMIGPGGWLIGDGADAVEDCEGSACDGRNGGVLWGNGGNGARGGKGGNAGMFGGNGGRGGDGYLPGQDGGDGGDAGIFASTGNGGDGGHGADGGPGTRGGHGGAGGDAGRLHGNGGAGGNGGNGGVGVDSVNPSAGAARRRAVRTTSGRPDSRIRTSSLTTPSPAMRAVRQGRARRTNQSGGAGGTGQGVTGFLALPHRYNISGDGGDGGNGAGGGLGGDGGDAGLAQEATPTCRSVRPAA